MELTVKDYIEEHRKMWEWISEETARQQRLITKDEYFSYVMSPRYLESLGFNVKYNRIKCNCFCCAYCDSRNITYGMYISECACEKKCPIDWPGNYCGSSKSPYHKWYDMCLDVTVLDKKISYDELSKLALEISKLPVNEIYKSEVSD